MAQVRMPPWQVATLFARAPPPAHPIKLQLTNRRRHTRGSALKLSTFYPVLRAPLVPKRGAEELGQRHERAATHPIRDVLHSFGRRSQVVHLRRGFGARYAR